jgi:hypothetical protein
LVLPIITYTLYSTKLEIRAKFLPGSKRVGGRGSKWGHNGGGGGKGGEMTQTLYAHMNKIKFKKSKKSGKIFLYFSREDMWVT